MGEAKGGLTDGRGDSDVRTEIGAGAVQLPIKECWRPPEPEEAGTESARGPPEGARQTPRFQTPAPRTVSE